MISVNVLKIEKFSYSFEAVLILISEYADALINSLDTDQTAPLKRLQ